MADESRAQVLRSHTTEATKCILASEIAGYVKLTSTHSSSSFALLFVLLGTSPPTTLRHHLLLHHIDDLIRDSQILDGASSDVALGHAPELVTILA